MRTRELFGYTQITRREWYLAGGFEESRCIRITRNKHWIYLWKASSAKFMELITFMDVTWDTDDPEQVKKVLAMNLTNEWATYVDLDKRRTTMTVDIEKLQNNVETLFESQVRSAYTNLMVEVRQHGDDIHVEVSQM